VKKAYIVGLLVISLALGFTLWAFSNSLSPFVDIKTARTTSGPVQVRGFIVKDGEHTPYYDSKAGAFRFWIVDKNKELCEVVYHGAKPDAFDAAPGLSASGVMARDAEGKEFFNSDSLSVQCPSKYNDHKVDYSKKPSAGGPV
jgi:cytochrome c-type biogenesis protein CcmE